VLEVAAVLGAVVSGAAYLTAVRVSRPRGWPRHRTALFLTGLGCAVLATVGPLARAAHHDFPAHVTTHLLVAMAAPLLLVRAAPVTLALRALPIRGARGLSRVLGTRAVRWLTEPVVAVVLDLGGLWVFYRRGLLAATHTSELLHVVTHAHMFTAGVLFTIAIIGVDPMPHRRSFTHRAAVLLTATAAHGILTKTLYVSPPVGVGVGEAETGAKIMYYGGDVIEVAMMVVLCAAWYRSRLRSTGRARTPSASRTLGLPHGRSTP